MCAQGFYEAMTLAFYADADLDALHIAPDAPERNVIRIVNPISSNLTIMRSLLAPSLLNVAVTNLKKGNAAGRLFELSNIYVPKQLPLTELPEERLHLGFAAWGSDEDFFTVKGAVAALGDAFGVGLTVERAADVAWLHPGIAAYILCKGERVGVFGKLANDVTSELKLPKDSRSNLNRSIGSPSTLWSPPACTTPRSRSLPRSSAIWPWLLPKAWSAAPSSPRCSAPASS